MVMSSAVILGSEVICQISGLASALYAVASIGALSPAVLMVLSLATAASLAVTLEMLQFYLNGEMRFLSFATVIQEFVETRTLHATLNLALQAIYLALCGSSIWCILALIKYQLMFIVAGIIGTGLALHRRYNAHTVSEHLTVSIERVKRDPLGVCQRLLTDIDSNNGAFPKVHLYSEACAKDRIDGDDDHGISRHLVQELFARLFKGGKQCGFLPAEMDDVGYAIPYCPAGYEAVYQGVGELLGSCHLHDYPIGPVFSDRFVAILGDPALYRMEREPFQLGRLMRDLMPHYSIFGRLLMAVVPSDGDLQQLAESGIHAPRSTWTDKRQVIAWLKRHFPESIECLEACKQISIGLRRRLAKACKVFGDTWADSSKRASLINSMIGSQPTKDQLSRMIVWTAPCGEELRMKIEKTKCLFLQWMECSAPHLADWCFAVTATRWPRAEDKIEVQISSDSSRLPSAATCARIFYLPVVDDYPQLNDKLHQFLFHALQGTGFQLE